ncbi:phage holin family protein [Nocardioides sp. HDW12B]|uniref:phage holin family protein n=1 Tax=Nocardioides sp. HDW12B TaxID=2714939 RepID=UPI001F0F0FA9|nr:phage holin family protein [Nocardioides sp. HDW12B]
MTGASPAGGTTTVTTTDPADPSQLSTAQLVSRMTEQTSTLVRSEMELAKAEIQQTVKDVGRGAGLFGASGVLALYGGGALVATVILGLSTFLDGWLAALIVTVVLFAIAGVAALAGKKKVQQAAPPVEATKRNVARDIAAVKEARS